MKYFTAAAMMAAVLAGATSAQAEAMPSTTSWTGFHVGAHAGYAWSDTSSAYTNPALSSFDVNMKPAGEIGGVQAGYDYQLPNNIVLGIETDISLSNVSDTIHDSLGSTVHGGNQSITSRTEYSGSIRARVGYAIGNCLPYITGGYAYSHSRISATDGPLSTDVDFSGWAIGGGADYALGENVSVRAEYVYADFGSKTIFPGQAYESKSEPTSSAVRIGVNYKF
ncbi:outer membrane protein [Parvibaculum sp.]|uniref:outer membrane protein n=1 Tax=Parvibaculum sp. TaxID=2024848 RepID=UPI002C049A6A|nr:outer membrane protein [Parvibaculum sp.]HUD52324.1 outer membrane protein [Parvibaculum sp.]